MTDKQIQDIADRVIDALHQLAPAEAGWWVPWSAFGSYAALLAAIVAFLIGMRTLKQQKGALEVQRKGAESTLGQRQVADDRAEWWRRTQWALEATASENEMMSAYGNGMLMLLAKSKLASDEDKDLLDTAWKVDTAAADEEHAQRLLWFIDAFTREQPGLGEDDKALLDVAWKSDTAAAEVPDVAKSEAANVPNLDAARRSDTAAAGVPDVAKSEAANVPNLDDSPETGENESTKEA
jgi:hypothetical protein